ncbi:hypothetical protein ACTS1J_18755 [Citrobacter freundii]|uniref:hypothetical protein n=1 Tax=Citrobacter freundii TaxID=546 RepID=UPI0024E0F7B9|nr:hypothetical protein [Citrobacter freundii]WOR46376.1 hypothetical protein R4T18_06855 [Citrobacter freundii]
MGSNIIELAKLGHERAAELKGSYEAINACSVAQLISDLATQLEVQFVRSTNMAVQLANAESKCRDLAAENESMHETIEAVRSVADNSSGIAGWHLNGDIATWEEILPEINEIKTQATDAFLAEVRAQARNEGINYAAGRLAAAFNHGFVDKPLTEVCDVVRMILDTKEELENSTLPAADGISGEYAEEFIENSTVELRKGVQS